MSRYSYIFLFFIKIIFLCGFSANSNSQMTPPDWVKPAYEMSKEVEKETKNSAIGKRYFLHERYLIRTRMTNNGVQVLQKEEGEELRFFILDCKDAYFKQIAHSIQNWKGTKLHVVNVQDVPVCTPPKGAHIYTDDDIRNGRYRQGAYLKKQGESVFMASDVSAAQNPLIKHLAIAEHANNENVKSLVKRITSLEDRIAELESKLTQD